MEQNVAYVVEAIRWSESDVKLVTTDHDRAAAAAAELLARPVYGMLEPAHGVTVGAWDIDKGVLLGTEHFRAPEDDDD